MRFDEPRDGDFFLVMGHNFRGNYRAFEGRGGSSAAHQDTDILAVDELSPTQTFAGYLYGGIRAYPYQFPYQKTAPAYNSGAVSSRINDLILKVFVERRR